MKNIFLLFFLIAICFLRTYAQCGVAFPNPVADFISYEVCHGIPTNFNASSSTIASPGSIISYQWNFGGATATGVSQSYILPIPGAQYVSLKVTSSDGCADSITKICTVNPVPFADFTAAVVAAGQGTTFQNTSTISSNPPGSVIAACSWDFTTDGVIDANSFNVSYLYPDSGNFTATLCVVSNHGCQSCTTQTVRVDPNTAGINVSSLTDHINIFPNPAKDILFISFENKTTNFLVKIFDELGQEVLNQIMQNNISNGIDISKLSTGIYFVQMNYEGKTFVQKIIKY